LSITIPCCADDQAISGEACILLIEDNPDMQELVLPFSNKAGFRLECAEETASKGGPGHAGEPATLKILLDLNAPKVDGLTVCQRFTAE